MDACGVLSSDFARSAASLPSRVNAMALPADDTEKVYAVDFSLVFILHENAADASHGEDDSEGRSRQSTSPRPKMFLQLHRSWSVTRVRRQSILNIPAAWLFKLAAVAWRPSTRSIADADR